jgi:hypothetical protein
MAVQWHTTCNKQQLLCSGRHDGFGLDGLHGSGVAGQRAAATIRRRPAGVPLLA